MTEYENAKYGIVDESTPVNSHLTAHFKKSFAYFTISERLPKILTGVIDQLSKDKDDIINNYGDEAKEDLKNIIGSVSKLKYEVQTDKNFTKFNGKEKDNDLWNSQLDEWTEQQNSYFSAIWLYAECYMYRKLKSIFENTKHFSDYDYFTEQKRSSLISTTDAMIAIGDCLLQINSETSNDQDLKTQFQQLLKINLWGNKCDLSLSVGQQVSVNALDVFSSFDDNVLSDHSDEIWDCIRSDDNSLIDLIHDNSGYELFTDFCLADFLIEKNLAKTIRFHAKAIPWFVSDVTPNDFSYTISTLKNHENKTLSQLGQRWSNYIDSGKFQILEANYFWTTGYEYKFLKKIDPKLHELLSESKLVIFKGDLNYRKLLGDVNWDPETSFKTALQGFGPTNVCSLRTVKADCICGVKNDVVENLSKTEPEWMETGKYGVIQFSKK